MLENNSRCDKKNLIEITCCDVKMWDYPYNVIQTNAISQNATRQNATRQNANRQSANRQNAIRHNVKHQNVIDAPRPHVIR